MDPANKLESLQPQTSDSDEKYLELNNNEKKNPNNVESGVLSDHLKMLKQPEIVIYLINVFLWNTGSALMSVLAYSYYIELGYSPQTASLAMTCDGIGSLAGSVMLSILSFKLHFNRLYMHWALNFLMVVLLFLFPVVRHDSAMTAILACFGCTFGMLCANLGSLTQHINGNKLIHLAYSYEMAAGGVSSFIGPIIAAHLQITLVPEAGFWFGGACCGVGLIVMVVFSLLDRSRLRPKETESDGVQVGDAVVSSIHSLTTVS